MNPIGMNKKLTEETGSLKPTDLIIKEAFDRPLKKTELLCAKLWAENPEWDAEALAIKMGKQVSWVESLAERSKFKEAVGEFVAKVQEREPDTDESITELFNREIRNSVKAITAVRDDKAVPPSARLRAAEMLLDRATRTPRARQNEPATPNVVINIPYQQVNTLKKVAQEEGDQELLDFFELGE